MFRSEYIEEVREKIANIKGREESLRYIYEQISEKEEMLDMLNEAIQTAQERNEAATDGTGGKELTLERAIEIALEEAAKAIEGTEYDLPGYKNRLFQAIRAEGSVRLYSASGRFAPTVDLKAVAGTTRDYFTAIRVARKNLKVGKSRRAKRQADGRNLASIFWQEKYYAIARENKVPPQPVYPADRKKTKTGKTRKQRVYNLQLYKDNYDRTIVARLSAFGDSIAPFWELLNNGNAKYAKGDTGDTFAYPVAEPTHFIEKAEQRMRDEHNAPKARAEFLQELVRSRQELLDLLRYLRRLRDRLEEEAVDEKPDRELVIDAIKRQLGERYRNADPIKVQQLADELLFGAVTQERYRVGGGERVRIIDIQRELRLRR